MKSDELIDGLTEMCCEVALACTRPLTSRASATPRLPWATSMSTSIWPRTAAALAVSSHIIFSKYASTGDGILTSLKMMEVMLAKKKPLSVLAAPLKIYPQVLENVRVTDKKAAQDDEAVQAAVKAVLKHLVTLVVFWCASLVRSLWCA